MVGVDNINKDIKNIKNDIFYQIIL